MSQLAFRNFNYVSGKHMNIPWFFIFVLFSMKAKTFPAHICWKKAPPVCKNWQFPVQIINIEKTKNDSSLATTEHRATEALQFWRKITWRLIWLIKILKRRSRTCFRPGAPQYLKLPLSAESNYPALSNNRPMQK